MHMLSLLSGLALDAMAFHAMTGLPAATRKKRRDSIQSWKVSLYFLSGVPRSGTRASEEAPVNPSLDMTSPSSGPSMPHDWRPYSTLQQTASHALPRNVAAQISTPVIPPFVLTKARCVCGMEGT